MDKTPLGHNALVQNDPVKVQPQAPVIVQHCPPRKAWLHPSKQFMRVRGQRAHRDWQADILNKWKWGL